MTDPSRHPPANVRRALRQEVSWGCPVHDCGNPYLEYHHFDPPWEEEHHHDPARMVALCATHHAKAQAWTVEDLRTMKKVAPVRSVVEGRFEWMRRDVLAIVGGNYYYETPCILELRGNPIVWFDRDDNRRLMLSLRMLSTSGEPRAYLDRNDWVTCGEPSNVESPPSGRLLRVQYQNGDDLQVEFKQWKCAEELRAEHGEALEALGAALKFPLVTAQITMAADDGRIKLTKKTMKFYGMTFSKNVSAHGAVGLSLN